MILWFISKFNFINLSITFISFDVEWYYGSSVVINQDLPSINYAS